MRFNSIIIVLFWLCCLSATAQRHTINGYVMDAGSKETLIGATILEQNEGKGCATNSYGFFTLTLPEGEVNLQVAFVGYEHQNHRFQ